MSPGINTIDTSLNLIGRGYPNYGEKTAENFLHLLENFASPISPVNPIEGQLWYDTSDPNNKILRIMDGTPSNIRWPSVTGIYQQITDPKLESSQGLKNGDIWVDTGKRQLKIYGAGNWTTVGPSTSTDTGAFVASLPANTGGPYDVILNKVSGKVISIVAKDAFTPGPRTIAGFTSLVPGVNLATDINAIFNGVSSSTYNLSIGNSIYPVSSFLRKNNLGGEIITGKVSFVGSYGVTISSNAGDNTPIRFYKNGNDAIISNTTPSGKIVFTTAATSLLDSVYIESGNLHVGKKLYVNGFDLNTSALSLSSTSTSTLSLSNTSISISTTTGALTVAGGVGIGGSLNVGNVVKLFSADTSISTTTGALIVSGGVGIGGSLNVGGTLNIKDLANFQGRITANQLSIANGSIVAASVQSPYIFVSGNTASASTTTGALIVLGGVGVGGNLNVGGRISLDNNFYLIKDSSSSSLAFDANSYLTFNKSEYQYYLFTSATTSLIIDKNYVSLPGTATSISTTTGALQVSGGIGVGGGLSVGGRIYSQSFISSGRFISATESISAGTYMATPLVEISGNTAATSTNSGALTVVGGAGIGGNLYVGGSLYVNGVLTSGSGGGSRSRTSVATSTSNVANGTSSLSSVTVAKGYALYSIQVSAGAWVTVYSSAAAQSADSSRTITTDPTPGSGVIAEAITTSATTTYFTPAVIGFNADASVNTNAYLRIVNNSGGNAAITVTLTYLPLEN